MKFLIDRCAGQRVATWLQMQGHDVLTAWERSPDPGDQVLLQWAAAEDRILVTIDTDFGALVYVHAMPHAGMIRLPDVPAAERILLLAQVLARYQEALQARALITVRGGRIRVSQPPS
jgi:predicted nuclease of predicted toxin-antitoxin system